MADSSTRLYKPPAFQFYPADFLTGTLGYTPAERGAYMILLCYQWEHGAVPDDTAELAKILGCGRATAAFIWRTLIDKFPNTKRGHLNRRLEKIRRDLKAFARKQRRNGKLGGRPPKPKPNPELKPEKALRSSIFDLQEDQDPDQDHRADARPSHAHLCLLAKDAYDALGAFVPFSELSEEVKSRAARAGLPYDSESVRKALDAVAGVPA